MPFSLSAKARILARPRLAGERFYEGFSPVSGQGGNLEWCDGGKNHTGPFFTISVLAVEVGPRTGRKGYKRISARQIVTRLCAECLRVTTIHLEGLKLISEKAQDTAND